MIACTRCGRWHWDAEKNTGRKLTCTEVKQYWSKIRKKHLRQKGHVTQITCDDMGDWICLACGARLL